MSQCPCPTAIAGEISAGFVIFRRLHQIQYLLLQASNGSHHWTPPKGHVDPGETDEMVTALRETQEEAGLSESDLKIFEDSKKVVKYKVQGTMKTVIYWLAELKNPEKEVILSDEHQDMKWLPLKPACDISAHKVTEDLLIFYDAYIYSKLS